MPDTTKIADNCWCGKACPDSCTEWEARWGSYNDAGRAYESALIAAATFGDYAPDADAICIHSPGVQDADWPWTLLVLEPGDSHALAAVRAPKGDEDPALVARSIAFDDTRESIAAAAIAMREHDTAHPLRPAVALPFPVDRDALRQPADY